MYEGFAARVERAERRILQLLIEAKDRGDSIAVYGGAGKGNTLLSIAGSAPISLTSRVIAIPTSTVATRRVPTYRSSTRFESTKQNRT